MVTREVRRGDIYKVRIPYGTGHEMLKDRPAVVVSCDKLNETSPCVEVVYCSTQTRRDLPEHVTLRSTPRICTAMCEHVATIDKTRLIEYQGHTTEAELTQISIGRMVAEDLDSGALRERVELLQKAMEAAACPPGQKLLEETLDKVRGELKAERGNSEELRAALARLRAESNEPAVTPAQLQKLQKELEKTRAAALKGETERDVYKALYDTLLNRYGRKARKEAVTA